jgi:hypothetical protein
MTTELTLDGTAGQVDFIEEHFHPAGSVRYTVVRDVEFEQNPRQLFDITWKEELRQV